MKTYEYQVFKGVTSAKLFFQASDKYTAERTAKKLAGPNSTFMFVRTYPVETLQTLGQGIEEVKPRRPEHDNECVKSWKTGNRCKHQEAVT